MGNKDWSLEDPSEARRFLRGLRFGPKDKKADFVQFADGKQVPIDEAPDEAICLFAKQLYDAMKKTKGVAKPPKKHFHPHLLFKH